LFGRLTGDEYYYNQVSPFCQHFLKVFLLFYAFLVSSKYSSFHRNLFPHILQSFSCFCFPNSPFSSEIPLSKRKTQNFLCDFFKKE